MTAANRGVPEVALMYSTRPGAAPARTAMFASSSLCFTTSRTNTAALRCTNTSASLRPSRILGTLHNTQWQGLVNHQSNIMQKSEAVGVHQTAGHTYVGNRPASTVTSASSTLCFAIWARALQACIAHEAAATGID